MPLVYSRMASWSDLHLNASLTGYNEIVEDGLLLRFDWQKYPGKFFENSVLAGSSKNGFFSPNQRKQCVCCFNDYAGEARLF